MQGKTGLEFVNCYCCSCVHRGVLLHRCTRPNFVETSEAGANRDAAEARQRREIKQKRTTVVPAAANTKCREHSATFATSRWLRSEAVASMFEQQTLLFGARDRTPWRWFSKLYLSVAVTRAPTLTCRNFSSSHLQPTSWDKGFFRGAFGPQPYTGSHAAGGSYRCGVCARVAYLSVVCPAPFLGDAFFQVASFD